MIVLALILFAFCGYQLGYIVASRRWYEEIEELRGLINED